MTGFLPLQAEWSWPDSVHPRCLQGSWLAFLDPCAPAHRRFPGPLRLRWPLAIRLPVTETSGLRGENRQKESVYSAQAIQHQWWTPVDFVIWGLRKKRRIMWLPGGTQAVTREATRHLPHGRTLCWVTSSASGCGGPHALWQTLHSQS